MELERGIFECRGMAEAKLSPKSSGGGVGNLGIVEDGMRVLGDNLGDSAIEGDSNPNWLGESAIDGDRNLERVGDKAIDGDSGLDLLGDSASSTASTVEERGGYPIRGGGSERP
jgi:hypothetical protein